MDFSFTPEQDDLRREARVVPRGEPVADDGAARGARLGRDPAGATTSASSTRRCSSRSSAGRSTTGRRPERGRGPAGRRRVVDRDRRLRAAPRPGRPRAHARHARAAGAGRAGSRPSTRRCGSVGSRANGAERARRATWVDVRRRLLAALALEAVGIGSKAVELAIAYVCRARAVRQEDRHLPGGLAPARRRLRRRRARALARVLGGLGGRRGRRRRPTSRSPRRSRRRREAAVLACETSIQAHGGIGFTWEHPLHRYYKRALVARKRARVRPRAPRGDRRIPVALVTGASTGIGAATARAAARAGWAVHASVRNAGEAPEGTIELVFDVTDPGGGRRGGGRRSRARRARRQRRHRHRGAARAAAA